MKKTLMVGLLSFVCAIACVFGLTACNKKAPVVKVGTTHIGDVTKEKATYNIEATVGKWYMLQATVNDETCMDVLVAVRPQVQAQGVINEFEYAEGDKVTVLSTTGETIKNVALKLTEVDAPVVISPEYAVIELNQTVTPTLGTEGFVTYKIVVEDAGPYIVTGDVDLSAALPELTMGKDVVDGEVEAGTNKVEIAADGTMSLERDTYYVTVYAEKSFKISLDLSAPVNPVLELDTPVTNVTLGTTAVVYDLGLTADDYGKTYKVTATVEGGGSAESVLITVGNTPYNGTPGEAQFEASIVNRVVSITSTTPLENVTLTFEEVEVSTPDPSTNPAITLGTSYTSTGADAVNPAIYTFEVSAADGGKTYKVTADNFNSFDFVIGSEYDQGELVGENFDDNPGHEGEITLAAGSYFVEVYGVYTFTVTEVTNS